MLVRWLTLSATKYVAGVRFGRPKSGWDRVEVGSGIKFSNNYFWFPIFSEDGGGYTLEHSMKNRRAVELLNPMRDKH